MLQNQQNICPKLRMDTCSYLYNSINQNSFPPKSFSIKIFIIHVLYRSKNTLHNTYKRLYKSVAILIQS